MVMSWRGEDGGVAAAREGHDVVMAPTKPTYLDYSQTELPTEPPGIGGHDLLEDVYAYQPVPKELSAEEAKHVLGAQGQIWTEYMPAPARRVRGLAAPRCARRGAVVAARDA